MITIKPYGGIGNRIRSIDSVIAFTKTDKSPVTLIWEQLPSLNCRFDKLFILPDYIKIVEKKGIQSIFLLKVIGFLKKLAGITGIHFPPGYEMYLYEDQLKKLRESNYDFTELRKKNSVYIETQHRFYSTGEDFREFRVVDDIRFKVEKIIAGYTSNTVGVHIRRTDNQVSIDNSPLEMFINRMHMEISENPDTRFFLATDSGEVEMKLLEIFKDRIIIQPNKQLGRNNPGAIRDALVDMLCLSRTRKILGSYWSSFSESAALMGNLQLIIVKKQDR